MIVRTLEGLSAPSGPIGFLSSSPIATAVGGTYAQAYATIYRTQPYVRTAVDFLARNVAALPLKVYRRQSDTDRERLTDHGLARWIKSPNGAQTRFQFVEQFVQDLGIYGRAIRLKVRPSTGDRELQAVRVPPEAVEIEGSWFPESYLLQLRDKRIRLRPSDVIDVRFFDPESPLGATAPIETLRRVLAEDAAMSEYREAFWKRGARPGAVIEQPHGRGLAPEQVADWQEQWARLYTGPRKAGAWPLLEPGMVLKEIGHTAADSELSETRRLTREEVAAAYHVPAPFLGLLDEATFSNVENLHRVLYQDVLGPYLVWLKEEIERQVLPEFVDIDRVYVEFDTAARLAGSFEDTAKALEVLAGRPVMTANEARARLNLSRMTQPDADQLWLQPGTPGAAGPNRTPAPAPGDRRAED